MAKVSVSELDKKTVSMLDKGIAHLAEKLKPDYRTSEGKPLSDKTRKKVLELKNKYVMQKGKTVNLFNKHKKKPGLKGLSVTTMSVEKIYQALGKETKDNAFAAWFRESPGRAFNIAGAGLATWGAIHSLHGTGVKTKILEGLSSLFGELTTVQKWGVSILGVGALALIVGHTMNHMQKNKFKNAAIKNDAEVAMNEGSVHDNEAVRAADPTKITSLAQEASVDLNLMKHLQDVIANPNTPADVADKAKEILAQAQGLQEANHKRAEGAHLKHALEGGAKGAFDTKKTQGHGKTKITIENKYSEQLKKFAIQQEVEDLLEQQNKKVVALDNPTLSSIGIDPKGSTGSDKDKYGKFIAFVLSIKKDAFDKVAGKEDAFVTMIKNHPTFLALPTTNDKLNEHINDIIKTRFNNFASIDKIAALNTKGVIKATAAASGLYDSSTMQIDGVGYDVAKTEGIKAILHIAEEAGITLTGADDNAKYASLCAKYGDESGVKAAIASIQKGELNLEGMEK